MQYGANLFFRLAPNVLLGPEISQLRTTYIGHGIRINNHYDLALAYLFSRNTGKSRFPMRQPGRLTWPRAAMQAAAFAERSRPGGADQFARPRRAPPQLFGRGAVAGAGGRILLRRRRRHVEMKQEDKHSSRTWWPFPWAARWSFPTSIPSITTRFPISAASRSIWPLYAPEYHQERGVLQAPGIVQVFCNIHSTMSAIIAVVPTPWYAFTPPAASSASRSAARRVPVAHLPRARAACEPEVSGAPHHRARRPAWRCR